jgi:hypothetical protein
VKNSDAWAGHGEKFWLVVASIPLFALPFSWLLFEAAIYVHYSLGVLVFFPLSGAFVALISSAFREDPLPLPDNLSPQDLNLHCAQKRVTLFAVSISACITGLIVLITMFAWISYAQIQLGLGEPTLCTATYASLIETYGWHLFDLLPLMNVESSLGMPAPAVEVVGWTMGAPILLFRLLVGVVVLASFREAWRGLRQAKQ